MNEDNEFLYDVLKYHNGKFEYYAKKNVTFVDAETFVDKMTRKDRPDITFKIKPAETNEEN